MSAGFGEAGSVSVTVMPLDWARTELSPLDAIRLSVPLRRHGLKVMTSTPASRSAPELAEALLNALREALPHGVDR